MKLAQLKSSIPNPRRTDMTKRQRKVNAHHEHDQATVLHIEKFRKERNTRVEIIPKNFRQEDYLAELDQRFIMQQQQFRDESKSV